MKVTAVGLAPDVGARPEVSGWQIRTAKAEDAPAIYRLVSACREEGRLLPRTEEEIRLHAARFLVVTSNDEVRGCAELAPLGASVAEVRSLAVDSTARGAGIGSWLVDGIARKAAAAGFRTVCAFTHEPGYFARLGFSMVPHAWLPEKIATDCAGCALFRRCGQFAMRLRLDEHRELYATMERCA